MILACNHISKTFGTNVILDNIHFHINKQEKAAIVGINGAGKSTLLKIIVGEMKPDSGEVILSKGATIGYLKQQETLMSGRSIYDEMLDARKDILEMDLRIREMETQMHEKSGEDLNRLLEQYTRLHTQFEQEGGYAYRSEVVGVLKGLGFLEDDFNRPIDTLSGGQKTRVALGRLLLSKPDLILLDEPTNHLDMESIAWLETYLLNYKGAVLIVAHDRYFLDRIVSKIVELEQTRGMTYLGNYTAFAEKKALLREAQLKQFENQQREIKHQEEVITKLRSFNREKSIKRAESRVKMLDKIERLDKPVTETAQMHLHFEPRVQSGNDVLTVRGLGKAFGSHVLFENLNFDVHRGERIAIIGNNGTGKTTILKLLCGLEEGTADEIRFGTNVYPAYYDQEHQVLHPDKTLFDELQDTYPDMDNTAIRNVLAAFLFTGDDVFKRIKDLSGGEKGRVSLAKLMLSDANLLILDEPTNHLDIVSKELLENALTAYTGTVLYVSHDRYFINKTATSILDLSNKQLLSYIGNYDYYLEKKEAVEAAHLSSTSNTSSDSADCEDSCDTKQDWKQQKEAQARERKRQNDLARIEQMIEELEQENASIDEQLNDSAIATNVAKLLELNEHKVEIETSLLDYMEQWEQLST